MTTIPPISFSAKEEGLARKFKIKFEREFVLPCTFPLPFVLLMGI